MQKAVCDESAKRDSKVDEVDGRLLVGGSGLPLSIVKEKERLRLPARVARARSDRCVSVRQKER